MSNTHPSLSNSLLIKQLQALHENVKDHTAILANSSALLNETLEQINWVGFYLLKKGELVLGPFQGKPACIHIPLGKGVCGTAAKERKTIRVKNVDEFPGHIACDVNSKSEIVLPIIINESIYGVLDIDSPIYNRFTENDELILKSFVKELEVILSK